VRTYGDSSIVNNSYSQYHVTARSNLFTHVPPLLPSCILGSAKSVVVVPDQLAVYTYNSLYDRLNGLDDIEKLSALGQQDRRCPLVSQFEYMPDDTTDRRTDRHQTDALRSPL